MRNPKRASALILIPILLAAGAGVIASPTQSPKPPDEKAARTDLHGDPLPRGAIARLGTVRLRHGDGIHAIVFSPDGKTLASSGADKMIRLWDVATRRERAYLEGDFANLAFSGDGERLAMVAHDGAVTWLDTRGAKLRGGRTPMERFTCAAFSPDGKLLAAATPGKVILLWDAATGKELHRLIGHTDKIRTLVFDRDGKTLASGSFSTDAVRVWDVARGRELRQFRKPGKELTHLALTPDGKFLVTGDERKMVWLWEVATGKLVDSFEEPGLSIDHAAFTSDRRILVTSAMDHMHFEPGSVRLWQVSTGKSLRQVTTLSRVNAVAFSPDDKLLAIAGWDNTIHLFDVMSGKELHVEKGHLGPVTSLAFAADGRSLITASVDNTIRFWDSATGRPLRQFLRQEHPVSEVVFSPDSRTLATVTEGEPNPIRLWDRTTGAELRRFGDRERHNVESVAFSADGKTLAAAGIGHTITLWDATTGKAVRSLACKEGGGDDGITQVSSPVFSPDGRRLAAVVWKPVFVGVGDPKVRLWDVATGQELPPLAGQPEWLTSPVFSPDGRTLAALESSPPKASVLRLWEVATGRERRLPLKDPGDISRMVFAPERRLLATAERGSVIRIWDISTGEELRRFQGHRGGISSLAFSPDGRRLASGSSDTTALVWDVSDLVGAGRQRIVDLAPRQLQSLWADLDGGDAARAGRAIWTLASGGAKTTAFLKERLRPVVAADARLLTRLLADLDSADFDVRNRATRELEKLGDGAVPALRKALAARPALEVRRRIEQVLAQQPVAHIQVLRAVEVLEHLGSSEARRVLRALAEGLPEAQLTREASASLKRLDKRSGF